MYSPPTSWMETLPANSYTPSWKLCTYNLVCLRVMLRRWTWPGLEAEQPASKHTSATAIYSFTTGLSPTTPSPRLYKDSIYSRMSTPSTLFVKAQWTPNPALANELPTFDSFKCCWQTSWITLRGADGWGAVFMVLEPPNHSGPSYISTCWALTTWGTYTD